MLPQTLSEPFNTDRKGEIPEGKKGYYPMPVVHSHEGLLTINYGGEFIQVSRLQYATHHLHPHLSPLCFLPVSCVYIFGSEPLLSDAWQ